VLQLFLPIYFAKIDHKLTFSLGYRFIFASCLSLIFFPYFKMRISLCGAGQKYKNKVNITVTGKSEPPCYIFLSMSGRKTIAIVAAALTVSFGKSVFDIRWKMCAGGGGRAQPIVTARCPGDGEKCQSGKFATGTFRKTIFTRFVTVRVSVNF